MQKEMTIFYRVHDNLYVNLTNKCPCSCTFCLRQTRDHMENSNVLWLDHTPSLAEVMDAMEQVDFSQYREVVFCGFGEPTEAFEVLRETARCIKERYQKPIRINTNGLGNLVNGGAFRTGGHGLHQPEYTGQGGVSQTGTQPLRRKILRCHAGFCKREYKIYPPCGDDHGGHYDFP